MLLSTSVELLPKLVTPVGLMFNSPDFSILPVGVTSSDPFIITCPDPLASMFNAALELIVLKPL